MFTKLVLIGFIFLVATIIWEEVRFRKILEELKTQRELLEKLRIFLK